MKHLDFLLVKKILDGNDLEKVIKYIDIHIGCTLETKMSASANVNNEAADNIVDDSDDSDKLLINLNNDTSDDE